MVHILARITVRPEAAKTAAGLLRKLVAESRKESGCVTYELYQQADFPHIFQTVEKWRDKASAEAHRKTPHVTAAIAAAGPLFAAVPEILTYNKLD
jgi:quinol monooxygenase YgiN